MTFAVGLPQTGRGLPRHRASSPSCVAVAAALERDHGCAGFLVVVLLVAATARLWVAVTTSIVADARIQLLFPAAGRSLR